MTVSSDQQDPSNDTFITTSTNEAAEAGGGNGVVDSPQILTQHPLINPAAVNFNNDVGNLDNLPEYMASQLKLHDTKIISEFKQNKLLNDAAKNWDYFYKRNSTHFFKDRHWLEREFSELRPTSTLTTTTTTTNTTTTTTTTAASNDDTSLPSFSDSNDILVKAGTLPPLRNLLEIGCGVGNFIFPLIAANHELFVYGCDFSKRAIELVKSNENYNEQRCKAFVCDVTDPCAFMGDIPDSSLDLVSAIFVLSAIPPEKMKQVADNLKRVLKPGGKILFRDYALYDQAMIRFKPGHKLRDRFYARQDGTFSYYFTTQFVGELFNTEDFNCLENNYIYKRVVNRKLQANMDRLFVQARFEKK